MILDYSLSGLGILHIGTQLHFLELNLILILLNPPMLSGKALISALKALLKLFFLSQPSRWRYKIL